MTTMRMQKQLYGIGIFEEAIVLSDFTDGPERRFVVDKEQLMAFFHSDLTLKPFPGLVWMKAGLHDSSYLIIYPAARRTILYRKEKELVDLWLAMPSIAVEAKIAEGRVVDIRMWAFQGRELKPESKLYELPLPNLTRSSLCLGGGERNFGDDVRVAVEKAIFDTPFNNHNYLVGKERIPFHDYVDKYKGKVPFKTLPVIGKGSDILGGVK